MSSDKLSNNPLGTDHFLQTEQINEDEEIRLPVKSPKRERKEVQKLPMKNILSNEDDYQDKMKASLHNLSTSPVKSPEKQI